MKLHFFKLVYLDCEELGPASRFPFPWNAVKLFDGEFWAWRGCLVFLRSKFRLKSGPKLGSNEVVVVVVSSAALAAMYKDRMGYSNAISCYLRISFISSLASIFARPLAVIWPPSEINLPALMSTLPPEIVDGLGVVLVVEVVFVNLSISQR